MRARGAGASPVQSLHPAFLITRKFGFPATLAALSPTPFCFCIFWLPGIDLAPFLAATLKYDSKCTKTMILTPKKILGMRPHPWVAFGHSTFLLLSDNPIAPWGSGSNMLSPAITTRQEIEYCTRDTDRCSGVTS